MQFAHLLLAHGACQIRDPGDLVHVLTPMRWSSALNTSGSLASVTETFINAPCMRV